MVCEPQCGTMERVYNHDLFFDLMAPAGQKMSPAVAEHFGGEEVGRKR